MRCFVLAAIVLGAPRGDVRFEAEGVRVGGALIRGAVLELQGAGAASVLASGSSLEALSAAVDVEVASGRTLILEPGVRVTRAEDSYRFGAHGHRKI